MSEKAVAIIQARFSSTRLPGKVLKKLAGKEMLWHDVERLKQCKNLSEVVIATSTSKEDDAIEEFAKKNNYSLFRGSENDVLSRYAGAAEKFNAKTVVRITSDCPLVSPKIVDRTIELHFSSKADYTNANRLEKTLPRGEEVEVFSRELLETAAKNASKQSEKEHVTVYFYHSHPEDFKIVSFKGAGKIARPELRLTVDTKEDFAMLKAIYNALYKQGEIISLENAIDFLDKHPEVKALNKDGEQKFVEGKQY